MVLVALAGSTVVACGPGRPAQPVRSASSSPVLRLPAVAGAVASPLVDPQPVGKAPPGGVSVDLSGSPTAAPPVAGVPDRIDIPALGLDAPVQILGHNADGSRQVPHQFDTVGWYSDTPRPGDPGPAVLAGHVDSYHGPAVFFRLNRLHAGDTVRVSSSTGIRQFVVMSVSMYPKDRFPTDLVFGPVADSELRLVTCGGTFDRADGSYRDNVVVFLTEVGT
jgi:LPXTG-site transpeptidase (sortase) family protein